MLISKFDLCIKYLNFIKTWNDLDLTDQEGDQNVVVQVEEETITAAHPPVTKNRDDETQEKAHDSGDGITLLSEC